MHLMQLRQLVVFEDVGPFEVRFAPPQLLDTFNEINKKQPPGRWCFNSHLVVLQLPSGGASTPICFFVVDPLRTFLPPLGRLRHLLSPQCLPNCGTIPCDAMPWHCMAGASNSFWAWYCLSSCQAGECMDVATK